MRIKLKLLLSLFIILGMGWWIIGGCGEQARQNTEEVTLHQTNWLSTFCQKEERSEVYHNLGWGYKEWSENPCPPETQAESSMPISQIEEEDSRLMNESPQGLDPESIFNDLNNAGAPASDYGRTPPPKPRINPNPPETEEFEEAGEALDPPSAPEETPPSQDSNDSDNATDEEQEQQESEPSYQNYAKLNRQCYLPVDSYYQPVMRIKQLEPADLNLYCPDTSVCLIQEMHCAKDTDSEISKLVFTHQYMRTQNQIQTATDASTVMYHPFFWDTWQENPEYKSGISLIWNSCYCDKDKQEAGCMDFTPPSDFYSPRPPWNILSVPHAGAVNPMGGDVINTASPNPNIAELTTRQYSKYNCCYMYTSMHPMVQALWHQRPCFGHDTETPIQGWGIYTVFMKGYGGAFNPLFVINRPFFGEAGPGIQCLRGDEPKASEESTPCIYEEQPLVEVSCSDEANADNFRKFGFLHKFSDEDWQIYLLDVSNLSTIGDLHASRDFSDAEIILGIRIQIISMLPNLEYLPFVINDCHCGP